MWLKNRETPIYFFLVLVSLESSYLLCFLFKLYLLCCCFIRVHIYSLLTQPGLSLRLPVQAAMAPCPSPAHKLRASPKHGYWPCKRRDSMPKLLGKWQNPASAPLFNASNHAQAMCSAPINMQVPKVLDLLMPLH